MDWRVPIRPHRREGSTAVSARSTAMERNQSQPLTAPWATWFPARRKVPAWPDCTGNSAGQLHSAIAQKNPLMTRGKPPSRTEWMRRVMRLRVSPVGGAVGRRGGQRSQRLPFRIVRRRRGVLRRTRRAACRSRYLCCFPRHILCRFPLGVGGVHGLNLLSMNAQQQTEQQCADGQGYPQRFEVAQFGVGVGFAGGVDQRHGGGFCGGCGMVVISPRSAALRPAQQGACAAGLWPIAGNYGVPLARMRLA